MTLYPSSYRMQNRAKHHLWRDTCIYMGFPGSSTGKESACNVGHLSSISGLGRSPGEGYGNLLQCSCLENPHGQRSLAGYSPWGCKELDTNKQLSTRVPQEILNNDLFVSSLNFILTFIYFCLNTC